ncbi:MAG TPA: hypothetical protein VEC93_24235, partial [Anaerolineae bacterium]|nr:hypothetical protein [Anaerolineae bacterium]
MTQPLDRTRPTSPVDKLQYAINLAKTGQKVEARDALRRVVALQPVNQAAWLWLSAVATEQAEAEAAIAQARKINPAHPSLFQAEQWLVSRFSSQSPTIQNKVVTTVPTLPPSPPPPAQAARSLPKFFNLIVLGIVALALLIGLLVLFLGLAFEVNATPGLATDDLLVN